MATHLSATALRAVPGMRHVPMTVGMRRNVRPCGMPATGVSHRGQLCSSDAFLAGFDRHDPVFDALARIARETHNRPFRMKARAA